MLIDRDNYSLFSRDAVQWESVHGDFIPSTQQYETSTHICVLFHPPKFMNRSFFKIFMEFHRFLWFSVVLSMSSGSGWLTFHQLYSTYIYICILQFNKDADMMIEEMKLRVVYTLPSGSSDNNGVTSLAYRSFRNFRQGTMISRWDWLALCSM
mgnify:CR=1 FL=1